MLIVIILFNVVILFIYCMFTKEQDKRLKFVVLFIISYNKYEVVIWYD